MEQLDGSKVMFVKSHPAFGSENYQPDRDCFASFRAPARSFSQGLMIEVVEGHIAAESYFAFESKRETEKYQSVRIFEGPQSVCLKVHQYQGPSDQERVSSSSRTGRQEDLHHPLQCWGRTVHRVPPQVDRWAERGISMDLSDI